MRGQRRAARRWVRNEHVRTVTVIRHVNAAVLGVVANEDVIGVFLPGWLLKKQAPAALTRVII